MLVKESTFVKQLDLDKVLSLVKENLEVFSRQQNFLPEVLKNWGILQ